MSIIYEALKKVEEGKKAFVEKKVPRSLVKFGNKAKKKFFMAENKNFILAGLTFLTLGALFLFIIALNSGKSGNVGPVAKGESAQSSQVYEVLGSDGQTLKKITSGSKVAEKYSLQGIVYDEGSAFAIINGLAVRELEKLDNFIITTISQDKVEMIDSKKNVKLTLSF